MKKLRSRLGFTLTETLIAVVLLGILASGSAVASGVLISMRNGMIATADGEALGSTLMEALTHEVRYGQNITTDEVTSTSLGGTTEHFTSVASLDSLTFGAGARFELNGDNHVIVKSESMATGTNELLISESAYTNLIAKDLKMEIKGGTVIISLTVADSNNNDLWSKSVTVTPLNGIG